MNKSRRSKLADAMNHLAIAKSIVESVSYDEQASLDSLPENLQDSERAEKMSDAIEAMDDAVASIEDASTNLTRASE